MSADECKTPDAMFEIAIHPNFASVKITHPDSMEISEAQAKGLEDEMHDAMEEIFAHFYVVKKGVVRDKNKFFYIARELICESITDPDKHIEPEGCALCDEMEDRHPWDECETFVRKSEQQKRKARGNDVELWKEKQVLNALLKAIEELQS